MAGDEIVEEVRAVRQQIFQQAGGTLEGLFAMLKELESKEHGKLVSYPPRKPDPDRGAT